MGLGDFLEGAAKATGRAIVGGGKDIWHTYDNTVKEGQHVVGGLFKGADALIGEQGVVGKSLENPTRTPQILAHANQTAGAALQSAAIGTGEGLYNGAQFVYHHPRQSWEMANQTAYTITKDQVTNPVNVALLLSTGGASAFMAGAEGVTAGVDAYKAGSSAVEAIQAGTTAAREGKAVVSAAEGATAAAEGASAAAKGVEGASEGASAAAEGASSAAESVKAAGSGRKFLSGPTPWTGSSQAAADRAMFGNFGLGPATGVAEESGGVGGAFGKYGDLRANKVGDFREAIGLNRVSRLQEGRAIIGEQVASRGGAFNETLGRFIGTTPGGPEFGGRAAELQYKAQSAQTANQDLHNARTVLHVTADPKSAAMGLAQDEFAAHKDDIVKFGEKEVAKHADDVTQFAEKHVGNLIKDKVKDALTSDDKPDTSKPIQQPQAQPIAGYASLQLSDGGFVAPRKQQQVGTDQPLTTTTSTMPNQIGPSHWYGDNKTDYASGRGFRSPASQDAWGAAS